MTRPALPLPMAVAREWLRQFRTAREGMAGSRNHPDYLRYRSNAHQCQMRVRELRAECPRGKR